MVLRVRLRNCSAKIITSFFQSNVSHKAPVTKSNLKSDETGNFLVTKGINWTWRRKKKKELSSVKIKETNFWSLTTILTQQVWLQRDVGDVSEVLKKDLGFLENYQGEVLEMIVKDPGIMWIHLLVLMRFKGSLRGLWVGWSWIISRGPWGDFGVFIDVLQVLDEVLGVFEEV